jgi:acetylornithine deacetylase
MSEIIIDKEKLLTLLQDMIRINSVNPSLVGDGVGERDIGTFIGTYLKQMGLDVRYQKIDLNRVNVIGVLKGSGGGKTLMLNGHTDTVGIEGMKDTFKPQYEDGKIFGRGAIDMKSGLAAMIIAVQSILNAGIQLKGDVILAFVIDEEYASIGTEELLKEYTADAAIVTEPTDLQIAVAHKGFAWIKVEVYGKAAHGSLPDEGIDAIVKAGQVLVEIENLQKNILQKKSHPLLGSPSIHASLISGGLELSTYPDYCKIEIERRTLPNENRDVTESEIGKILKEIKERDSEFNASFDVFFYRPALEIDIEHEIVKILSAARLVVLSEKTEFVGKTWWMDSALLAEAGIPTVVFGPTGKGLHAAVEYVEFESVVKTTEVLVNTIIQFCEQ